MSEASQVSGRPWGRFLSEFILIVAGVLVALAVDSWADGLADRQRERAYLVQLRADLQATRARADTALAAEVQIGTLTSELRRAFDREALPPPDSLASLLEGSLFSESFTPASGTVYALINSGELALIRNADLRSALIRYRQLLDNAVRTFDLFDEADLDAVMSLNRRVNRDAVAEGRNPTRYPVDWELIAADRIVRGDLMTHAIASYARAGAIRDLLQGVDELFPLVDSQLGN